MLHNKQVKPIVTAVLPTYNRPFFLDIAVKLFLEQDYPYKELIIIDDSEILTKTYELDGIHHVHLKNRMSLGDKMNLGVKQSLGSFILKMDDDDFYGKSFISELVNIYPSYGYFILFHQPFVFFDLNKWRLRISDSQKCSGATFFFKKTIWDMIKFRNKKEAVDSYYLIDYHDKIPDAAVMSIFNPINFMQIRHNKHTWVKMPNGESVDSYLDKCKPFSKDVKNIIPNWLFEKYHNLHKELLTLFESIKA